MPKRIKPYWSTTDQQRVRLYHGDATRILKELPDACVQSVVTSPPYWSLRNYRGTDKRLELGCEPIADCERNGKRLRRTDGLCGECYVCRLVEVFREVKRVLRPDGTVWLNLGDTYSGGGGSVMGLPWRVAFALNNDGWTLRQDIVWAKPNPVPESAAKSRCTKAHEYVFLLTTGTKYYYDAEAIKVPYSIGVMKQAAKRGGRIVTTDIRSGSVGHLRTEGQYRLGPLKNDAPKRAIELDTGRNRPSFWTIGVCAHPGSHCAVFPPELVRVCLSAGTSRYGACPTCGRGWERVISRRPYTNPRPTKRKADSPYGSQSREMSQVGGGCWPSTTVGWRPGCDCYGVPRIEDPPRNLPLGSRGMDRWRRRWRALSKAYNKLVVEPQLVLDPFVGSGTTVVVALGLGLRCWGIDLSETYLKNDAIPRIQGAMLDHPGLAPLIGAGQQAPVLGRTVNDG